MGNIEDLGSAILVKVQDTKNYKSLSFWGGFTWKFAERTITIIKFWTSLFCHIKKITLNHALLKLSQVSNDKILSF
jgi:hypothetical protein